MAEEHSIMRDGRNVRPEHQEQERLVPRHVPILVAYVELDVSAGRLGWLQSVRPGGRGVRHRLGIFTRL
jgi:hypothetical protein